MLPKELLKKIRHIEIKTGRLVNDLFAGQYESVFKGRGMEFAEVREYFPGDDIRTIDWNVTARMGHPYVKQFVEEREMTVMIVADMSASSAFGTAQYMKKDMQAELAALLAFSAIRNNDKIGLIAFTDKIEKYIPPKKGKQHVLRLVRELLYFEPEHKATDLAHALEYLNKVVTKRCVVFVISDFLSVNFERALRIANKKHDVVAITITDPREETLPAIGLCELEDAETGDRVIVDLRSAQVREQFRVKMAARRAAVEMLFRSTGIDAIRLSTDRSYIEPIISFFKTRARRIR